uniref:Uncharacterized protein n=1 Tax=Brassica campestris TaxID=3711 RepID=M4F7S7_BRACM
MLSEPPLPGYRAGEDDVIESSLSGDKTGEAGAERATATRKQNAGNEKTR